MRFFFYGTLMDPDLRAAVLGPAAARLVLVPAVLAGFRRVHAPGQSWPVLIHCAGARVDGVVVDVDQPSARRLVRYEGPAYRLVRCFVCTVAGVTFHAVLFLPHAAGLRQDVAARDMAATRQSAHPHATDENAQRPRLSASADGRGS
ncbi:MAG: gamma-glutamylcyclotransferase [Alphaproteobacteria bacterium]|nr:gamma-glutamylcyclotransferase [Alphaproteobacteria bacterium]